MFPLLDEYRGVDTMSLPAALITRPAQQTVYHIARSLPQCGLLTIETALAPAADNLDFALGLSRGSAAGRRLLPPTAALPAPHADGAEQTWRHVSEFVGSWVDPFAPLYAAVKQVWLQWSAATAGARPGSPGVVLGLVGDASRSLTEAALSQLLGRPLSPATRIQLARCYGALPPLARVTGAGALLARSDTAVRLHISSLRGAEVGAYLARIGWTGPLDQLTAALAPFDALAAGFALNVDIGAGVARDLSVDCCFGACEDVEFAFGWSRLLSYLTDAGLCTPEKQAALREWQHLAHTVFPVRYPEFVPALSHIRLRFQPGRPLTATAHWGLRTVWSAGTPFEAAA